MIVTRDEFIQAIKGADGRPVDGTNISVMEFHRNGVYVASAEYSRPSGKGPMIVTYRVNETPKVVTHRLICKNTCFGDG